MRVGSGCRNTRSKIMLDFNKRRSRNADTQQSMSDFALGIDVGTSAVRVAAVDADGRRAAFAAATMPSPFNEKGLVTQHPAVWWKATRRALQSLARQMDLKRIGAIAVDGTSGTVLGVDANGQPVAPAQM